MAGWIKIHRKMLSNPVVFKDPDHLAVWMYLLLTASHKKHKTLFGGKPIFLEAGQLITGRQKIARETKVEQHKVDRIIKLFKTAQLIEQQAERYGSIISILNWDKYQNIEQQSEQRMSNERATSEQRVSTKQECKEGEEGNKNNKYIYSRECSEIVGYLNEVCGTSYKPTTKETRRLIQARMNDGFTVEDFKTVIYKKAKQWKDDPRMCGFLRPQTLFGTKFESYLNENSAMTFEERVMMA